MPTVPEIEAEYVEGSSWKVHDPNTLADVSLAYVREWGNYHDNTGRHEDDLIPMEAATVNSAGTILQGSSGIAVSKVPASTGRYLIDLSASPMVNSGEWFAHVYPDPQSSDVVWGFESEEGGATAKSTTVVEVRFVDDANSLRDTGFWVGCYGVRA